MKGLRDRKGGRDKGRMGERRKGEKKGMTRLKGGWERGNKEKNKGNKEVEKDLRGKKRKE